MPTHLEGVDRPLDVPQSLEGEPEVAPRAGVLRVSLEHPLELHARGLRLTGLQVAEREVDAGRERVGERGQQALGVVGAAGFVGGLVAVAQLPPGGNGRVCREGQGAVARRGAAGVVGVGHGDKNRVAFAQRPLPIHNNLVVSGACFRQFGGIHAQVKGKRPPGCLALAHFFG